MITEDVMLKIYIAVRINPPSHGLSEGIRNAISKAYTGSLALQLISGMRNIVRNLSLLFAIVRVAIIAGIAHANPERRGTNDFPFKPILDRGLSISIAPRARYPESSSSPKIKNKIRICGRKTSTDPSPLIIPLETRSPNHPSPKIDTALSERKEKNSLTRSITGDASQKIDVNVIDITRKKIRRPEYL